MFKRIPQIERSRLVLYASLLVILVVVIVVMNLCDRRGKDKPVEYVKSELASGGDTIDVAIEYSPGYYYTYDDTLGGFNYDLLRLIARENGVKFKFHPIVTLSKGLDGIEKGYYAILAAEYPVTRENKKHYLFTKPLYLDKQVLVQRKGENGELTVKTQLDLDGDTVCVVANSPMRDRLSSLAREIGDTIHVKADALYGPEQLVMMVASGEIKYAVVNEGIARSMAQRYPQVDYSTEISLSQFQTWAVNINNEELLKKLDDWIAKAKKSPKYNELLKRYF